MPFFITDSLEVHLPISWLLETKKKSVDHLEFEIWASPLIEKCGQNKTLPIIWNTKDIEKCGSGFIFLAQKGIQFDALEIRNDLLDQHPCFFVTGNLQKFLFTIFEVFIEKWADKWPIPLIGVTGTNGKTSTTFILGQIISKTLNSHPIVIGTLGTHFNNTKLIRKSAPTMPGSIEFTLTIGFAVERGASHIIFEATSHGLDQNRLGHLKSDVAVFLNLTRDHLDYHKTMENYENAKRKLFKQYLKKDGFAVINANSPYSHNFIKDANENTSKVITYSLDTKNNYLSSNNILNIETSINFNNLDFSNLGFRGDLFVNNSLLSEVNVPLIGNFHVENVLACLGVCSALKIPLLDCINSLKTIKPIEGRLEVINRNPLIIVDYAHTPDAIYSTLMTLQNRRQNSQIITIVGCGGNRDIGKRPQMGQVAIESSDVCIFTSDNPRFENPHKILDDIVSGIPLSRRASSICISDRKLAIHHAIKISTPNDIIAILGKGHENYQEINGTKFIFSDKDEALQFVEATY